ncbi:sulfite reductase flavoprotein component [Seiridium cupressi]
MTTPTPAMAAGKDGAIPGSDITMPVIGGQGPVVDWYINTMQLRQQESGGGADVAMTDSKTEHAQFTKQSSSSPFGQLVSLDSISGPTYVTGQLLVQQVAYKLSDKIFSYSPETFDLDVAVKDWSEDEEKNIHGYTTNVLPLQTRTGAGAFALGYIFSKDFDLSKRHIPQTLLAPSLSLRHLRSSLDQLALLYGVASPFVAHIAAADYSADAGLVSEYGSALQIAEDLGLGLVSSTSTYEAQHISLFATLMAKVLPTLHIYDGVRASRETLRVVDALSETGIAEVYKKVSEAADSLNKRLDDAGKVTELLKAFNGELGTDYELFEYIGDKAAETVFVVFGSIESQLAKQVVEVLASKGVKVGAVGVRVYRPFVEEAFLSVLPETVKNIAVLGQVSNAIAVSDVSVQSALYADVLTAVSFADKWTTSPSVVDVKYPASEVFTPTSFATILSKFITKDASAEVALQIPQLESAEQYIFWDADSSVSVHAPTVIGGLLSRDSTNNVYASESYDNLVQGGVVRTDLRTSKKSIDTPYAIEEADAVFVNEEKLLKEVASSQSVKPSGKFIVKLPNFKADEIEKRLPAAVRRDIQERDLELYVLDPTLSASDDEKTSRLLVELAFLKITKPDITSETLQKLVSLEGNPPTLQEILEALDKCLSKVDIPEQWADAAEEASTPALPASLKTNSFTPFEKEETESEPLISDWQAAAKGLVFKEAYSTEIGLRPEQTVQTYTIRVKENRRLTPATYDRNIFHIEFDLGTSGLTYKIGEALGIHADNDPELVQQFIESYGLNGDQLVQIPARECGRVETRTVFQALMQNIDIFGKPPKRFYETLADFATDETETKKLRGLGAQEGADEFKKRSDVDTITYADILEEFPSAHLSFTDIVRLVGPLKRREYSIASAQAVAPNVVALMIVVVNWVDPKGRQRYGQATRYLSRLPVGTAVTASVKPSVMKLPTRDEAPLIMAGLGTGLAPFRAFVQYRAMQKAQGKKIGDILLYLGSRHQREEYLYGEEWEAYLDSGVITLLGAAFSRDQPQKIYIQDRMRQTISNIVKAYIAEEGSFYLCGPTWPVPDVTEVLEEAIATEAKMTGKKVDPKKEIERLKEDGRYVLEYEENGKYDPTLLLFFLCLLSHPDLIAFDQAKVPGVGYGKSPIFASWRGAIKFMLQPRRQLWKGYQKYRKSYFKISTLREEYVLVSDRRKIAEYLATPEDVLSSMDVGVDLISGKLTQNISNNVPFMLEEINEALNKTIGDPSGETPPHHEQKWDADSEALVDWTEVSVWDLLSKVVIRAISQAFVGSSLCKNEEYLDNAISFTKAVAISAEMIRLLPVWLKPYAVRVTPSWRRRKLAEELMKDEIIMRLRVSHKDKDKPNDLLQWIVDASPAKERTVKDIAERIMGLNVAAIHTTTSLLTSTLALLATDSADYISTLRRDVEANLESGRVTQKTMTSAINLDSFLRESGRLNLTSMIGLMRAARKDFRFTDGKLIPAGTRIGVPAISIHTDPAIYSAPEKFDAFRFARWRERTEDATSYQLASTEMEYLTFGHGKHACAHSAGSPGRFFAAGLMKLVIAAIVLRYDIKLAPGTKPKQRYFGKYTLPDTSLRILVRRRNGSV